MQFRHVDGMYGFVTERMLAKKPLFVVVFIGKAQLQGCFAGCRAKLA
jgi:hypothetical protein